MRKKFRITVCTVAMALCSLPLYGDSQSNTVVRVIYRWLERFPKTASMAEPSYGASFDGRSVFKARTNEVIFTDEAPVTVKALLTRIKLESYRDKETHIVRVATNGVLSVTEINWFSIERNIAPDVPLKSGDLFVVTKNMSGMF